MKKTGLNHFLISRVVGGESQILPQVGFGPFFFKHVQFTDAASRKKLLDFPHLDDSHDDTIRAAFEHVREGLSPDRFLCDPRLSIKLQRECRRRGLNAPEPAINLRLLALRKRGHGVFKATDRPARAYDIVDRLGPGVEAAMMFTAIRYGASVDDMLAHPAIGRDFVRRARSVSPGGTGVEYRMCALQIRKGRNASQSYMERMEGLSSEQLTHRWQNLGDLDHAAMMDLPNETGIIHLHLPDTPLYVMRAHSMRDALENSFGSGVIRRLFESDPFFEGSINETKVSVIARRDLPEAPPKAWELTLIQEWMPRFNWPIWAEAA